jgi:hypothetical protein
MKQIIVSTLMLFLFVPPVAFGQATDSISVIQPDTLTIQSPSSHLDYSKRDLYSGISLVLVSSVAAWQFHHTADRAYERYLREGNLARIDSHYNRARTYDRYTSAAYLGVQAGFLIVMKAFLHR